jgi:hypothetical protein
LQPPSTSIAESAQASAGLFSGLPSFRVKCLAIAC